MTDLVRQAVVTHEGQRRALGDKFTGKTDIEFIVDAGGKVLIKQARPFPADDIRPSGD